VLGTFQGSVLPNQWFDHTPARLEYERGIHEQHLPKPLGIILEEHVNLCMREEDQAPYFKQGLKNKAD
jgi:hypothetical protein